MALEDIERLKEKVSKDPNSKLFVPLAEEYKKAGLLDEAIEVLTGGLENQPGYLSARVSLGKIFIEKGMLSEARTEFEKVIASIPDNLYAHKKLAEIYSDLGDKDKAIKEFRTVLKLNPIDDRAAATLAEMEQQPAAMPEELPVPKPEGIITVDKKTREQHEQSIEISDVEASPSSVEMREGKTHIETAPDASLSKENMEPRQPPPMSAEELRVREKEVPEFALEAEKLMPEEPSGESKELRDEEMAETDLNVSEEDMAIWKSHAKSLKSVEEEAKEPATATDEEEVDLWEPLDEIREPEEQKQPGPAAEAEEETMPESVVEADEIELPEPVTKSETEAFPAEEPLSFEGILHEKAGAGEKATPLIREKEPQGEEGLNIGDADRHIVGGKYFSAMNIYRKILARDPDNKQALQRVEELRALLKLMGKDKEELVSKLDGFLEGIRKRRDEFSGNT